MHVLIVMCFESFRNSNHPFQLVEFKPILYSLSVAYYTFCCLLYYETF